MTAAYQLVAELHRRGVALAVVGDRLRATAPPGALTPDLRAALAEHKADVLRMLGAPAEPLPPPASVRRDAPLPPGVQRVRADGGFRYVDGLLCHGDICWGWEPAAWAAELRRKADRCDAYRPDVAAYYRRWADGILGRLGGRAHPEVDDAG